MEEIKCEQVGMLSGGKWDKLHDQSRRVYSTDGLAPTLHTCGDGNLEPKITEPVIIDEIYNNREPRLYAEHCPTIRAERQGLEVVEPIAYDEQSITEEPIVYDMYNKKQITNGICGTLTCHGNTSATHCGTFGVLEPNYRFFEQAFETLQENNCEVGDTIDAFNKRVNKDGVSPTLTTRPDGFKTAILPITQDYRIRKLTERECFRLQGVKGEDFERVAKNQSTSSLYHLAGDSIVTTCLMAIFGGLFNIDYVTKITNLVNELKQ